MHRHSAYITLQKKIGETPLECMEAWRATEPELTGVPLAYAGRLDPMATGTLLVLIGDTCKVQEKYHGLDKAYTFEVLFGARSDSGDVLGIVTESGARTLAPDDLVATLARLTGTINLPYPIFSSRTVLGKPLHTWTIEGRLHEITIPTKTSEVYSLTLDTVHYYTRAEVVKMAREKIDSLPPVTDPRKALGNDFRRPVVRESWQHFSDRGTSSDSFLVATLSCIASSGTYMRSLSEAIATDLGTSGLAFSIHRDKIGTYDKSTASWSTEF